MITNARLWLIAAAALGTAAAAQPGTRSGLPADRASNNVRVGVEAWQAGNYDEAVRQWRPLADRGDADAQYNIAQAYFLGRGVPQNMNLAEQWYERAARQGHEEAQANYGLLLFQNGRRREAMPWIERAANRGDARAQYVLGTSLFNGDVIARDLPRAYAMMTRAAQQNLAPAVTQLAEMERHLTAQDRARGVELARELRTAPAPTQIASAAPPPMPRARPDQPGRERARPAAPAPAPAPARAAAGGRWRIQLGAFSNEANARRAWSTVGGRLGGLQPYYVRAGAVVRLQAGPLASRAAAERTCAAARVACFPVAP
ncbi:MAG TPA: SPOR domain-containing protein [Allosphingosinicella sp.]|nr:SPOR domain-containing protein [Allosphingosinicella sp.]